MSLVSIIMPYYKKEFYVLQSIESILNQTHQSFEIIIINDDNENIEFIDKFSKLDHRIRVVHNDKNLGAGPSRNKGIKLSKGEYIAFCDCDDLWKNEKLEAQLNFMKNFKLTFSHTSYDIIDENSNFINTRKAPQFLNFEKLRNSCDIGLSTVMIKKDILKNNLYQFASLKTKEDYVMWMRLAEDGVIMRSLNQSLTKWRKSKNSLSSSLFQKLIDGYKVYRVYLRYGRFQSFYRLIILSINFVLKN